MKDLQLHILAGQSNAQGFYNNDYGYPADVADLDKRIFFFYEAPGYGNSGRRWGSMEPQNGMYLTRHFGPEVEFGRRLVAEGCRPAIFKFTKPATSLPVDWKRPGENGLFDALCDHLTHALHELKNMGLRFCVCSVIWIQGESDAETEEMAAVYEERLNELICHLKTILKAPDLPIVLGVDESHPWIQAQPLILSAQKRFVQRNRYAAFLSMEGLEKSIHLHLTPESNVAYGRRLFDAYNDARNDKYSLT